MAHVCATFSNFSDNDGSIFVTGIKL